MSKVLYDNLDFKLSSIEAGNIDFLSETPYYFDVSGGLPVYKATYYLLLTIFMFTREFKGDSQKDTLPRN